MKAVSWALFVGLLGVLVHGQSYGSHYYHSYGYSTSSSNNAAGVCQGTAWLDPSKGDQSFTDGPAAGVYPNGHACEWVIATAPAAIRSTATGSGSTASQSMPSSHSMYSSYGHSSTMPGSNSAVTPAGSTTITLSFSRFSTEQCCDHVEIWTYNTDKGYFDNRLHRLNGDTIPAAMEVTASAVLVKFWSDGSVQRTGFEATVKMAACKSGQYSNTGRPPCSGGMCPVNTFGVAGAKNAAEANCVACAPGQFTAAPGSFMCVKCPAGTTTGHSGTCDTCLGGYYPDRSVYLETSSGTPPSDSVIKSLQDCSAAAAELGLTDTTASDDGQSGVTYDPPGCYYEGSSLKFNSNFMNSGGCTSSDNCVLRAAGVRCTACPTGKWTTSAFGAQNVSACDICRPGFRAIFGSTQTIGACAQSITSFEECTRTANSLGFASQTLTAVDDNQNNGVSYDPPGCYYEGASLKFNPSLRNYGPCTSSDMCVCRVGGMYYPPSSFQCVSCPLGKWSAGGNHDSCQWDMDPSCTSCRQDTSSGWGTDQATDTTCPAGKCPTDKGACVLSLDAHREHTCASEGSECRGCKGTVFFGMQTSTVAEMIKFPYASMKASDVVHCTADAWGFGHDPLPGAAKHCLCATPYNSACATSAQNAGSDRPNFDKHHGKTCDVGYCAVCPLHCNRNPDHKDCANAPADCLQRCGGCKFACDEVLCTETCMPLRLANPQCFGDSVPASFGSMGGINYGSMGGHHGSTGSTHYNYGSSYSTHNMYNYFGSTGTSGTHYNYGSMGGVNYGSTGTSGSTSAGDPNCAGIIKQFNETCLNRCDSCRPGCTFRNGVIEAGRNHTQLFIGHLTNELECFARAFAAGTTSQRSHVGATFLSSGACYAEFGVAGVRATDSSARVCKVGMLPASAHEALRQYHGGTHSSTGAHYGSTGAHYGSMGTHYYGSTHYNHGSSYGQNYGSTGSTHYAYNYGSSYSHGGSSYGHSGQNMAGRACTSITLGADCNGACTWKANEQICY